MSESKGKTNALYCSNKGLRPVIQSILTSSNNHRQHDSSQRRKSRPAMSRLRLQVKAAVLWTLISRSFESFAPADELVRRMEHVFAQACSTNLGRKFAVWDKAAVSDASALC